MRVLVVTVVHHPQDARIYYREISSLLDHNIQVSYAAAFESFVTTELDPRIEQINLPRATGKQRASALMAVKKLLRARSSEFDLVLLHDPELLLVAGASKTKVVWDVHEDTMTAISAKSYLPKLLKPLFKMLIKKLELTAERRYHLLLAETEYQKRFKKTHPVIPNTSFVPELKNVAKSNTAIYLGNITKLRGGYELIELAKKLLANNIKLEIVGTCPDAQLAAELKTAAAAGNLVWHGYLPNDTALKLLPGKLAGLALLHDHPNYRVSQPTKIYEYMAAQLPVISTPLPQAAALIDSADCGYIVDFNSVSQVVAALVELAKSDTRWHELGNAGYDYVVANHNWETDQKRFISALVDFLVK